MLKRSMLLQRARSFISKILVLNKYISNTDLKWKTISVLFPTKGFTQRPSRRWPENLTSSQEQRKVCHLPQEVCGAVGTTGLLPCSVQVYMGLHKQTAGKSQQRRLGCMTGDAQCPLAQPQQKALRIQSHVALLVTEPQFREVLPWSHL